MNKQCCVFRGLLPGLILGALSSFSLLGQDMVKVAPDLCKVRLDNEWVRVVEVRAKAGDKMAMHSHPGHLTYFLGGGKAKMTSGDGQVRELDIKPGTAQWNEPTKHSVEFLGPGTESTLVVEVKKPTGKKAPAGVDAVKAAPETYKVVFENDEVRVLDVRVKPGATVPAHTHPAYVAYDVTATKARFTDASGKSTDTNTKAGDTVWSEPEIHSVTSLGSSEARVVVVELKK